jgi:uncharacterized membrane protein SirB2
MSLYFVARLLHVAGALGLFMTLGVDLAGLTALGRAQSTGQVRRALEGYGLNAILGPLSMLLLLVPGIYLATVAWAWAPWLRVSFLTLVAIFALGATMTRRRLGAIARSLDGDDRRLTPEIEQQVRHPLLRTSFVLRTLLSLGIFTLMTTKPDLGTSLGVIATAAVVAAGLSTPFWMRARQVPGPDKA